MALFSKMQSLRFASHLRSISPIGGRDAIAFVGIKFRNFSSLAEVPEFESDCLHDEAKYIEKDTALRMALQQLSGDFTHESMLSLKRFFRKRRAPVIPTGSLKLDEALGIGGLPKGRMVEIYGREASGKTTLALHVIKEAQKRGGYCAYLDVENALDPLLAESMGVDLEKLLFSQPDSAEHSLSMVDSLTKSGSIDVIVVDSVAALVPQCELDVSIGGTHRDEQSRIMTKALRKIHYSLCNSRTLIIFLNQVRANVKSAGSFGPADEVTCGGNALKFYAAVRLRMVKTGLLKTNDEVTGLGVCIEVVKNKLAPAMKKAELQIQFGKGFNCVPEVLQLACDYGVVMNEGSNYFIGGEILRSTQAAEQYLAENEVILDDIVKTLRGHIFNREI